MSEDYEYLLWMLALFALYVAMDNTYIHISVTEDKDKDLIELFEESLKPNSAIKDD